MSKKQKTGDNSVIQYFSAVQGMLLLQYYTCEVCSPRHKEAHKQDYRRLLSFASCGGSLMCAFDLN